MKIQYLGTAAAEGVPALFCECENCRRSRALGGRNIRSRSQALVDDTILIDFPPDTFLHFLQYDLPMHRIKTCLVTHSHSDHLYPADLEMRGAGYANLSDKVNPLTFYSGASTCQLLDEEIRRDRLKENEVRCRLVETGAPFQVEGYAVTTLEASHDPTTTPVIFLVEKDGRSLLYANDTGEFPDSTWACLRDRKKPISLVSLDCTQGCLHSTYSGHMDLWRCRDLRQRMVEEGIANGQTIFVLNHFSHNGLGSVYDDFQKTAGELNFVVSYDGMILEF